MPKAKPLDRAELTRRKFSSAKELAEHLHDELIVKRGGRVSASELERVIEEAEPDSENCPVCGAKIIHESGCVRCTCGWSRC